MIDLQAHATTKTMIAACVLAFALTACGYNPDDAATSGAMQLAWEDLSPDTRERMCADWREHPNAVLDELARFEPRAVRAHFNDVCPAAQPEQATNR